MIILQIEHSVPIYEGWKKVFDSDPINRKKSGVKRYRIYRPAEDPHYVIVDLEFDNVEAAQATLKILQSIWHKVEGTVMVNPKTRILEILEETEL